jgi:hypothetical protein
MYSYRSDRVDKVMYSWEVMYSYRSDRVDKVMYSFRTLTAATESTTGAVPYTLAKLQQRVTNVYTRAAFFVATTR